MAVCTDARIRMMANALFSPIRKYPMTEYRIKLKWRVPQAGIHESLNRSHRGYSSFRISKSGNRMALSIQQVTDMRMAAGSVKRPAVTRFWNLWLLIGC